MPAGGSVERVCEIKSGVKRGLRQKSGRRNFQRIFNRHQANFDIDILRRLIEIDFVS